MKAIPALTHILLLLISNVGAFVVPLRTYIKSPHRMYINTRFTSARNVCSLRKISQSSHILAGKNDDGCNAGMKCIISDLTKTTACMLLYVASLTMPTTALAAGYNSVSPEQKVVAEAWRTVDGLFLDRTFNSQDWFQLRQDAILKTKGKNMEVARKEIDGMLGKLGDKYTRYLTPDKYLSMVNSATGTLAGVGVEIGVNKEGSVFVKDVEDKSPAASAGVRKGDVFVEVDGQKVIKGETTPDAVAGLLRGPEGTKVGIVLGRDNASNDFIVTRAKITVTSVKSYLSEKKGVGKIGVIRIKSISGTTAATVKQKITDFKKAGVAGYVIDMRGNPGGLLPGGVETASLFLEENKPVVFVVSNKGVVDSQCTISSGVDLDTPLVLFVDGNTASAAEVITAALKENKRAIVAGEQTFGKGIVQTIRELSNQNGGIAITLARYETPNHNDINKQGIAVDVPVADCSNDDAASCLPASAFVMPTK